MPPDADESGPPVVKSCPLDKKTHFLEIELHDEDGEPVAGEEFRVVLPSGEAVRGFLDDKGFQRFGPVDDAGQCEVSFPNQDQSAVRPA